MWDIAHLCGNIYGKMFLLNGRARGSQKPGTPFLKDRSFEMNNKRPTMLLIMDGFGLNPETYGNAIAQAETPALDRIFEKYPMTRLDASGLPVGLPDGQMGNSEVGHTNIGAGRVVYQDLTRITKAIQDGSFDENTALNHAISHVLERGSKLHLFGLLSPGGVHSHTEHLYGLIDLALRKGVREILVHAFLDGRDVPPRSALEYFEELESRYQSREEVRVCSVSGRYYAMDRDKRWERVQKAYDCLTLGEGMEASSASEAVKNAYERDENDEFVLPTIIRDGEGCIRTVDDGDAVIMYNFRPDRAREITRCFCDPDFDGFSRRKFPEDLVYICMTEYDASMPNVELAFPPEEIVNPLGEYISSLGLKQLRIAETEKYAHVTFFFNGGLEEPFPGEDRILVPSPKVATYDLQPEMSAYIVTEKVIEAVKSGKYDMIILNFANADMVGHTGIMEAAVKAIETLDACVPKVADAVLSMGGQVLLTADHGNADVMLDHEGNVVTSHSLNKVPFIHIAEEPCSFVREGKLADIAPTMLKLMGLPVPPEMTGESLV